jgi:hypothetical protein
MRPFKPVRRVIPFSVFRNMKPNELKAIGANVKPPMFLTPSDVKPKPSEAAVYYQLHEAVAPPRRVMSFREWCEQKYKREGVVYSTSSTSICAETIISISSDQPSSDSRKS